MMDSLCVFIFTSTVTQWVAKNKYFFCFLHADSEDSEQTGDQTGWLPRPIQVFDGHKALIIGAHIRKLVST